MRIYLDVPYSEKECAKSFGARWDADRKLWCVPDGVLLARFERWLPSAKAGDVIINEASKKPKIRKPGKVGEPRVDSYIGKTTTGNRYFKIDHDCNPLEVCARCKPMLDAAGWGVGRR